jgi:hypothetical protein
MDLDINCIMKSRTLVILTILLFSCSSVNYFDRALNKESEMLNKYLYEFLYNSEGYSPKGSEIHLDDVLWALNSGERKMIKDIAAKYKDTLIVQALMDLSTKSGSPLPINFTQLTDMKEIRIIPGLYNGSKESGYWNYSLSQAGFSKDSTRLCFIASYYCGPLCNAEMIVFMGKDEIGKWVYMFHEILTIS